MRARDYCSYHQSDLKFYQEIVAVLDRFADFRPNFSKTKHAWESFISTPEKWADFIDKAIRKKVKTQNHWDFVAELKQCISEDFSWIYFFLSICDTDNKIPSSESVKSAISSQYEDYPHDCIDDYLNNDINVAFIKTIDSRDYSEKQEIHIFDSAYYLFDQIRRYLHKPRHAVHIYKEFKPNDGVLKSDILRLLSYYVKNYNYDFSAEQRKSLDNIANQLGGFVNILCNSSNLDDKWSTLKQTLSNMISDDEKLTLLICEMTDFLQLPKDKQKSIDGDFAEKCQLEIDKIYKLIDIEKMMPSEFDGTRTLKVVTDTLQILMRKAGLAQMDNTKLSKLMGYVSGFSVEKIRQRLSITEAIPPQSKDEVDNANKLLHSLTVEESISIRKH